MPRLSKIGAAALAAFGWTGLQSVTASYLVVGGGGGSGASGGGTGGGGGGGAGGLKTGTASLNPTLSYTVTVGSGGAGAAYGGVASAGSDSVFNAITSTGGGYGAGSTNVAGGGGGSGGGGTGNYQTAGGAGTSGQGNNGGTASGSNGGGGGGGASAVGGNGSGGNPANGGNGGAGTASSITGSSVTYAGGGGGGSFTSGTGGTGGAGGGGAAGSGGVAVGTAGTANLGGGGGGSAGASSGGTVSGANGGSGVVIISYVGAQQFGGGVVTTDGTNTIHTFTTSGTLSPLSSLTAQYLVVAGGGGGGANIGGGGGAGGFLTSTVLIDTNSNYVVTVGAGGVAGVVGGPAFQGGTGGNSALSIVATTALGGGGGGYATAAGAINGTAGGSGGGAGSLIDTAVNDATGGAGTSGQGNRGGNVTNSAKGAGGGGGASAAGGDVTGDPSGAGGAGTASSISGTSVTYAGGGGAGGFPSSGAAGGAGGGGAGGSPTNGVGTAGTANTGGGGGGGGGGTAPGGNGAAGGSGVVIISYAGSTQQMAGGTVTISGGNVIHTFTSSGYLTPIKYASRSLRFRSSASGYLNRTFATPTSSTIWTWSAWVKRGGLTGTYRLFGASTTTHLTFNSSDQLNLTLNGTSAATTTAVYRDPSAWYHIVYQQNGSAQTIYVNNVSVATGTTTAAIFNTAIAHQLGAANTTNYFDGYMTEVNFIDGAALTPSSFGTFNSYGVWQPITYGGSYGANGFYLTFGDNTSTTTLGYDTSPQGNNWTTNNISLTAGATYDSMLDVPTLTSATVANYATWNPLRKDNNASISLANGNLAASGTSFPSGAFMSTIAAQGSGLWYAEITFSNLTYPTIAVADITVANICPSGSMNVSGVVAWDNNSYFINGSSSASGATFASNDVLGIAFDGSTRKVWFAKNNTWISSGNPAAGTNQIGIVAGTGPLAFACRPENSVVISANFGQQGFTYTPPSGFVALNTYNLSTPTILNGAVYMAATTYTGNGTSQSINNSVNGTSFQPDFVWYKDRSVARDHALFNVTSGATYLMSSNNTSAESAVAGTLTSFNSNGYSIGSAANANGSGETYVGWQWAANGTGVSNTSGSITSTVSANTTAGFAVVTYTGTGANATVGHGLGVAPSMIITKKRSSTSDWGVYHTSIGNTNYLLLDTTAAPAASSTYWNNTTPTSSVFSISTADAVNISTATYVAYVFAAVAGYSAFGSYTGNGSTDGPFVYLGFRPRFIFIKSSSRVEDWHIMDTSRSTYNKIDADLYPNLSNAEAANNGTDILSNGFKLRSTDSGTNFSGATYIYMAFAENPFKYANAR